MNLQKWKQYFWLFYINCFISAFTFGGGYIVIPMIRKYFVEKKKLFSQEDLMDMAAVAQSVPGAIAVNLSALAGYRTAGTVGAIISCIASILPPLLILSLVSFCYHAIQNNPFLVSILKGMEAGVCALIIDTVSDMCRIVLQSKQALPSLLVFAVFFGGFCLGISVMLLVIGGILLTITVYLISSKKRV